VLGDLSAHPQATPAEPSLEDGYIWLMQGVTDERLNPDGSRPG